MCSACTIEGVLVCTATISKTNAGAWCCDKGALSLEKAQERKRQIDEHWQSFMKATGWPSTRTLKLTV